MKNVGSHWDTAELDNMMVFYYITRRVNGWRCRCVPLGRIKYRLPSSTLSCTLGHTAEFVGIRPEIRLIEQMYVQESNCWSEQSRKSAHFGMGLLRDVLAGPGRSFIHSWNTPRILFGNYNCNWGTSFVVPPKCAILNTYSIQNHCGISAHFEVPPLIDYCRISPIRCAVESFLLSFSTWRDGQMTKSDLEILPSVLVLCF